MINLSPSKHNLSGFTLIEIMITTLILSFIISGIYKVLNIGSMAYHIDMGNLDLQQNARQVVQWVLREVRECSREEVEVAILRQGEEAGAGGINVGNDSITFDTLNEEGIEYYHDDNDVNGDGMVNQIIREYPQGTYRVIANNISYMQFALRSGTLEMRVIAEKTALNRDLSFSLWGKSHFRNVTDGESGSSYSADSS